MSLDNLSFEAMCTGNWLTDTANFCAYFFERTANINWLGFYFYDGNKLVLGPFQGKTACTEIALNRGVCGAAFTQQKYLRVADVHNFPGHIACDAASRSELVIPFIVNQKCVGVLDIDSPLVDRFTVKEETAFSGFLEILAKKNPHLEKVDFSQFSAQN